jgi:hypothetical protein
MSVYTVTHIHITCDQCFDVPGCWGFNDCPWRANNGR